MRMFNSVTMMIITLMVALIIFTTAIIALTPLVQILIKKYFLIKRQIRRLQSRTKKEYALIDRKSELMRPNGLRDIRMIDNDVFVDGVLYTHQTFTPLDPNSKN